MSQSNRPSISMRLRKERSGIGKSRLIKQIYDEIRAATKRLNNPEKAYVCDYDLKNIWWDKNRISKILRPDCFSEQEISYIQENMILILSTLVYLGYSDCLATFRKRMCDESGNPRFTDKDFPFELDELNFFHPDTESPHRQIFYDNQYRFKPVKIEVNESSAPIEIPNPKWRLPFETRQKSVGSGGFGRVDCVGVSQRYLLGIKDSDKIYHVACKKIKIPEDFDKEKENLQILKGSLTEHKRIMQHFATVIHGPNRYILLPYAALGDLEVFLHCGIEPGPEERKQYDFNKHFPRLKDDNITLPLLAQCSLLADALHWLHYSIKIERNAKPISCVHMDLKPANILIQQDDSDQSVVGKWVISDFGISVLKEGSEYGSIGDYIRRVTVNTRPTRNEGTHQAPEVKVLEGFFGQSEHLTASQRGIGRKSDVWSFGCILSEVLAFSLGKDKLVREFQSARNENRGDDYFYSQSSKFLQDPNAPKEYEVRPAVNRWFKKICDTTVRPQRWVECYTGAIQDILIVDVGLRPDSAELQKLIDHVREHIAGSLANKILPCPILNRDLKQLVVRGASSQGHTTTLSTVKQLPSAPLPPQSPILRKPASSLPSKAVSIGGIPHPTIVRSNTLGQEPIYEEEDETNDGESSTAEGKAIENLHESECEGKRSSLTTPPSTPVASASIIFPDESTQDRPGPHPVQAIKLVPSRKESSGDHSSYFTSFVKPSHAFGIMVNPVTPMIPSPSTVYPLPKIEDHSYKITSLSMAISSSGVRLACLSRSSVFIYALDVESSTAKLEKEIRLAGQGWDGIALSGTFLAVWGFHAKVKLLHFCDVRAPQDSRHFSASQIAMLQGVAISQHGVAALRCRGNIFAVTLDAQKDPVPLEAFPGQNFTDLSFNEAGDMLFAWAYGQKDSLYVWRYLDDNMNREADSRSTYDTIKKGDPELTRIIPYSTYQGCIILAPDKRAFPAQIHGSLVGSTVPHRNEIELFNLQTGCVFNDHSLLTLEKELFHRVRLKEYKIDYKSTHVLTTPAEEVCQVKSNADSSSRLLAVKRDDYVVVIISNTNATVEFINIVPRPIGLPVAASRKHRFSRV